MRCVDARLLLTLVGVVFTSLAHAQTEEELALRRVALDRAQQARTAGDHRTALDFAERAGAIQMTPSVRYFVAQEQFALGRYAAATLTAQTCVRETTRATDVPNRETLLNGCRDVVQQAERHTASIILQAPSPRPEGLVVQVGDARLSLSLLGLPYLVDPGRVVVRATASQRTPFEQTVEVATGETRTIVLRLDAGNVPPPPPPPPPSSASVAPWIVVGTGGALLIGGAAFAILLSSATAGCRVVGTGNDALWECAANAPQGQLEGLANVPTWQVLTGISFATGAAAIGGGVVWALLSRRPSSTTTAFVSSQHGTILTGVQGRW